ncbi:hypothetical protein FGG23_gp043 [Mycobacterium phage Ibhubesi]|uniref:Uncharacterized protein n=2 Tax=Cheoctovirus TaxID=1623281 RepID=A0A346FBY2_9CAUD|nr:hypothetical protein FGG23_gp043 [Mycobacterium phage Ibhubesi]YP_009957865.1 hypothetical protein I5H45_gp044 [Mycobacterium phage Harley]AEK09139.1 hypothetical protein PBI_IBHUBESI_43 [Mycobacterium phage Ibhubesi]AXN53207.1 hypothetical protein PBI_HARLEY_44 [Mycobacterium phage Harley]
MAALPAAKFTTEARSDGKVVFQIVADGKVHVSFEAFPDEADAIAEGIRRKSALARALKQGSQE